jgi:hypothetical protein
MVLLATGMNLGSHGQSSGVTSLVLMLLVALVLPLMSIAFVFMLPLRSARASRGDAHHVGLGDRSLQEEFWEFIDEVERGRVKLSDVSANAQPGAAAISGQDVGERRSDRG